MNYKTLESVISNPADRLEDSVMQVEAMLKRASELRMVRDRIANGTMTDELYTLINRDSSLESVFHGLSLRPDASASMEAVEEHRMLQLRYLDIAIEGLIADTKAFLIRLWRSFVEWIEDWIDANRRIKFMLQRHQRRLSANPLEYGTQEAFAKAVGYCYTYSEWSQMQQAAKKLTSLVKKVPATNPSAWFATNHKELASNFGKFGWVITDTAVKYDQPNFIRQERAIGTGAAGWSISGLTTAIGTAIADIESERTSRTEFQNVRRTFDRAISAGATAADKDAIVKLIKVCKGSKDCTNVVARAVSEVANIALRCARAKSF